MTLLEPGQIFAKRYRVQRFLAQGGMGAVFVAEQLATELVVALKVLFPQVLVSTDAVERFQLEARIAARVKSQHIVAVLDAGYDEETRLPFLAMELLSGQPLNEIVEREGPLGPKQVATYIAQASSGLDKAHGYRDKDGRPQPIVHRDLKPENLFLTRTESGDPLVKILDFGIAKVLSDTKNLSQDLKGTPLFMAYEQVSAKPITPQTDVWALGLVSFFLLTGCDYWRAGNREGTELGALLAEVLVEPIVPPSLRAAELGVKLGWGKAYDDWFLRCVNREVTARFPTAGEAARSLATALGVGVVSDTARGPAVQDASAASLAMAETVLGSRSAGAGTQAKISLASTLHHKPHSSAALVIALTAIAVFGIAAAAVYFVGASRSVPSARLESKGPAGRPAESAREPQIPSARPRVSEGAVRRAASVPEVSFGERDRPQPSSTSAPDTGSASRKRVERVKASRREARPAQVPPPTPPAPSVSAKPSAPAKDVFGER